jgi:N utilization substance protein B
MRMAIVEAVHFPSIPTKVTLNEYIEISKYYSTEKSSLFINGILDKVFIKLRNDEVIRKSGRGLIGEI